MAASTSVDTPIGIVGVEASDAGIRRVHLPGEATSSDGATAPPQRAQPWRPHSSWSSRAESDRSST